MGELKINNRILSFSLLKTEKGREKICKCDPPNYELDTVNRIITCTKCGATIEPFEVLLSVEKYMDKFSEYQSYAVQMIMPLNAILQTNLGG